MKLRIRRRTKWFRLRGILTNLPSKKFQKIEDATAGCVITKTLLRAVLGILAEKKIIEWIMVL